MLSRRLYQGGLTSLTRSGFAIERKLYVYDGGHNYREGESGIWATIFGGSGLIGHYVGAKLGYIGSNVIFPVTTDYKPHHSDEIKELKTYAATGMWFKERRQVVGAPRHELPRPGHDRAHDQQLERRH